MLVTFEGINRARGDEENNVAAIEKIRRRDSDHNEARQWYLLYAGDMQLKEVDRLWAWPGRGVSGCCKVPGRQACLVSWPYRALLQPVSAGFCRMGRQHWHRISLLTMAFLPACLGVAMPCPALAGHGMWQLCLPAFRYCLFHMRTATVFSPAASNRQSHAVIGGWPGTCAGTLSVPQRLYPHSTSYKPNSLADAGHGSAKFWQTGKRDGRVATAKVFLLEAVEIAPTS